MRHPTSPCPHILFGDLCSGNQSVYEPVWSSLTIQRLLGPARRGSKIIFASLVVEEYSLVPVRSQTSLTMIQVQSRLNRCLCTRLLSSFRAGACSLAHPCLQRFVELPVRLSWLLVWVTGVSSRCDVIAPLEVFCLIRVGGRVVREVSYRTVPAARVLCVVDLNVEATYSTVAAKES